MIYYLKTKVKLGDTVDYKGMKIKVTSLLINENPNLFKTEPDKKFLFTTFDSVDIYQGDSYCLLMENGIVFTINPDHIKYNSIEIGKTFSKISKAIEYLKLNRSNFLEYYENILLNNERYNWLKIHEPKLYLIKVFQLIARNLNGDWNPKIGESKYFIDYNKKEGYKIRSHNSVRYPLIYFKNQSTASIALSIMGVSIYPIFEL